MFICAKSFIINCIKQKLHFQCLKSIYSECFQFEEKRGTWKEYDENTQQLIRAGLAYKLGKIAFSLRKINYTIDLESFVETNEKKKSKRKLRKVDKEDEVKQEEKEEEKEEEKSDENIEPSKKNIIKKEPNNNTVKPSKTTTTDTKKKKSSSASNSEEVTVRSFTMKGKAPVDPECFSKDKYHVYYEGHNVYDAMLNQTNLKNNNNKFYLMQVLQSDNSKGYAVWFRWGRVGMIGQTNLINCGADLEKAKDTFLKK